jgi:hypothetical protein
LANLRENDPLTYAEKKKEWAAKLATTMAAIEQAVRLVLDKRTDAGEQSQATKLVAIGMGKDVELWRSSTGEGYATVMVDGHYENYRIESTKFERWLIRDYGRQNEVRINGVLRPQTPGSNSARDAVKQLAGFAGHSVVVRQPAIRVGGDDEVIWLDLGGEDWKAVRVTTEGWEVVSRPDVAFIRGGQMQPLPIPLRCGSLDPLKRVLNVEVSAFPLVIGWLLQTLNPIGPYPLVDISGKSGVGKSMTVEMLLKVTDPNTAGLRRPPTKLDDVFIAARNNWLLGYDNMSGMSKGLSDAFCMLATGISTGTRAHYTNDEEHVITVERPFIVSGIAQHLTERSDLASRAIKLQLPPLRERWGRGNLRGYFGENHGSVLGKLLDGLVGALRGAREIRVPNPSRLIEFEQFAEAGCRAMGFRDWEFVEAFSANRRDLT